MTRAVLNALAMAAGAGGMTLASLPVGPRWHLTGLCAMGACLTVEAALIAYGLILSRRRGDGEGRTP